MSFLDEILVISKTTVIHESQVFFMSSKCLLQNLWPLQHIAVWCLTCNMSNILKLLHHELINIWVINKIIRTCWSLKPYAKSISLCVTLKSPLRWASLTNEVTPSHVNVQLECWHRSIHTVIKSRLFAIYKCSASHSWPTVQIINRPLTTDLFRRWRINLLQ